MIAEVSIIYMDVNVNNFGCLDTNELEKSNPHSKNIFWS